MLDPLTSIGLATNVVQLVDFGLKVATTGHQIATKGSTEEHTHLESIAKGTSRLCDEISKHKGHAQVPSTALSSGNGRKEQTTRPSSSNDAVQQDENAIEGLAFRARTVAEELGMMLQGLKIEDAGHDDSEGESSKSSRKRKRTVLNRMVKAVWRDSDIQKLRKQLMELQQELILSLNVMQRSVYLRKCVMLP